MPRKINRPRVGSFTSEALPESVHYRVDQEVARWLQGQTDSGKRSHNAVARDCLLRTISQSEAQGEWQAAITSLCGDVKELRELILKATHGLLVGAGHLSKEEAADWVKRKLAGD